MRTIAMGRLAAGVIVAVVVLAGCRAAGPAGTAPRDTLDGIAFDLLTRSGTYQENHRTLGFAEEILVAECMGRLGFSYPVPTEPAILSEAEQTLADRRRNGYGLSGTTTQTRPVEPEIGEAAYAALFGGDRGRLAIVLPDGGQTSFPGDGCLFEGRSELYGRDILLWARVTHLPEQLGNRLVAGASGEPEYLAAMGEWAQCMRGRGYAYALPSEAVADLTGRYAADASEGLHREEIAIAVADAQCAQAVGVANAALAAQRHRLNLLTPQEIQAMRQLTVAWIAAARRASRVVEIWKHRLGGVGDSGTAADPPR